MCVSMCVFVCNTIIGKIVKTADQNISVETFSLSVVTKATLHNKHTKF